MRLKQTIKKLTVKKGVLIHINGLPFNLCKNTKVLGNPKNYKLAFNQSEHSCLAQTKPHQPIQFE